MSPASRSPAADRAGDPFRCVVCGRHDPQCLCRACRLANTDADGTLAAWVAAERREAQRQSARLARASKAGITVESFDRLDCPGRCP